MDWTLLNKLLL